MQVKSYKPGLSISEADWHGVGPAGRNASATGDLLRVATWNLENFPSVPEALRGEEADKVSNRLKAGQKPLTPAEQEVYLQKKIQAVAKTIVGADKMNAPHILAVQEMWGSPTPNADSTVSGTENAQKLIDAIRKESGLEYRYVEVAPIDNTSGGKSGANIRSGYFYQPSRVELAATATPSSEGPPFTTRDGQVHLATNPAALDVKSTTFHNARKPLLAEFIDKKTGEQYFLSNVHFAAGNRNPELRISQRYNQAKSIAHFNRSLMSAIDAAGATDRAHVMVVGDFNINRTETYLDSNGETKTRVASAIAVLEETGLTNLSTMLPEGAKSTYSNKGPIIDYMFASPALAQRVGPIDMLALDHTLENRMTDHNPTVVGIHPPKQVTLQTLPTAVERYVKKPTGESQLQPT